MLLPFVTGEESRIGISFEPTEIGEVQDVLVLQSADGGEYVCDLIAECSAPLPQGPFSFVQGSSTDISFRNCFSMATNWSFSIDSTSFRVASATNIVQAKSQGSVTVVFEPLADAPLGTVAAKLFVKCDSKPDMPAWVYYLKGKVEQRSETTAVEPKGKK